MFVANVTYYFEIFSWNLKKMRGRGRDIQARITRITLLLYGNHIAEKREICVIRA
jgi:hypothetical protein